jgi:hypothetical protein
MCNSDPVQRQITIVRSSIIPDHHLEFIMTKLTSGLCIATLAVVGALIMSSGVQASTTTKLLSCQANSKQKVVDCCDRILRTNQRPYWITSGLGGCGGVVACKAGGKPTKTYFAAVTVTKPKKCVVYIPDDSSSSSSHDEPHTPGNTPGRNPRNAGGKD